MTALVLPGYSGLVQINYGGSSTIYSAHDDRHNRDVAIKVLTFKSLDPTIVESLRRELRAMGLLGDHPHIMSVHDSGLTPDGSPYLVMPLFTEGSYNSRIATEGPLGWTELADIGIKLASALETAHQANVLHRDIKPDNIFTGHYRTHPVLGDFGISTLDDGEQNTTGAVAYTLKYAAPEVIEGAKQTKLSDVYSLGAAFRYLLTGTPPFVAASTTALINVILTRDPEPLPAGLPPGLVHLLDTMVDRNPINRPSTCLEVANQLRKIQSVNGQNQTPVVLRGAAGKAAALHVPLRNVPQWPDVGQREIPTKKDPVVAGVAGDTTGSNASSSEKQNKGRRWFIGGLSAAAVVVLVAAILVATRGTETPQVASPNISVVTEPLPTTEEVVPVEVEDYDPMVFEGHSKAILSVVGLTDGRVASASKDLSIRVWDPNNPDSSPEIYASGTTWAMHGLADGRTVAGSINGELRVWDPTDADSVPIVFTGHTDLIRSITTMPGERVVSGDDGGGLRVWDLENPAATPIVFNAHDGGITTVAELPGNRIASGGDDGSVKIWDLDRPSETNTGWDENPGLVSSIVATKDGRIIIGGFDGSLHIRDPDDLDADAILLEGHTDRVSSLDVMNDGRIISGSEDTTVRVWDLNDEVPDPIVLQGHTSVVTSVASFGKDQVVAGSENGVVITWDLSPAG